MEGVDRPMQQGHMVVAAEDPQSKYQEQRWWTQVAVVEQDMILVVDMLIFPPQ